MIIEEASTVVVEIASNIESREEAIITLDFILFPIFR